MAQAWNFFVNNFQVSNLLIKPTKSLCYWECITIPCDADTFHNCSTLFSVSKIEHWVDGWMPPTTGNVKFFQMFLTNHSSCCLNSKQRVKKLTKNKTKQTNKQTSRVNNSIICWIRNAKFLQYRFEKMRT